MERKTLVSSSVGQGASAQRTAACDLLVCRQPTSWGCCPSGAAFHRGYAASSRPGATESVSGAPDIRALASGWARPMRSATPNKAAPRSTLGRLASDGPSERELADIPRGVAVIRDGVVGWRPVWLLFQCALPFAAFLFVDLAAGEALLEDLVRGRW